MAERGAGLGLTAGHVERTSALPTGTVTFLLTDIEGSTRLWEQSPDLMRAALIRHDAIIERLVAEHGGTLVRPRGEGDSRFAVFKAATDAVGAACAIQIELTHESWPLAEPLRVRMALHTTEADLRDSDYYGRGVNRCARLRALACGGQILVSGSTAMVVRDQPLAHVTLKNLGTRNLKDVVESEQIFQVRHSELPDSVDVILCHEGQIGDDVKQLVRQLTDRGLRPLLSSQLRQDGGGQDLEASLATSTSCAVLVGSRGLSDWEEGPLGSCCSPLTRIQPSMYSRSSCRVCASHSMRQRCPLHWTPGPGSISARGSTTPKHWRACQLLFGVTISRVKIRPVCRNALPVPRARRL